jgi:long-chain acyl-CoA synthetase
MHPSLHATSKPDAPAVIMAANDTIITYQQLEDRSNQCAQLFRALGVKRGDAIAIFMDNRPEYFPLVWGAQRSGLYFTCISSKLTASEVDYIVRDCGAKIVVASAALAAAAEAAGNLFPEDVHCLSAGGDLDGYASLEDALAGQPIARIADESPGRDMLYSSGTTGRPKGIKSALEEGGIADMNPLLMLTKALYDFNPDMMYLSPAPLYHAAPLRYCMAVHKFGGTTVIMDHFEPEAALATMEKYRITHSQWVPTMFVRLLKLPKEIQQKYDLSALKVAVHAAAPCPIEIKEQMIGWWGEKIYEYYSATEGAGFTAITPQEWLVKKGSVGKALLGVIKVLDDEDRELGPGETGRIFFADGPVFEYHNDAAKMKETINAKGWATFGDIGHVDAEGYLFLTDRKAFMIISGGVNVYPQETENILIMHPKVADVAVIGVPHEELGEAVKAVVQPVHWSDATPELEAELIAFARSRLSAVKTPKSIDFDRELPRHPTGKLYKRLIRDRYWGKAGENIV